MANIITRFRNLGKVGRMVVDWILFLVFFPLFLMGLGIWILTRPFIALSHLLMLNPYSALDALKEWKNPTLSLRDKVL